jgi:hypothetical protein
VVRSQTLFGSRDSISEGWNAGVVRQDVNPSERLDRGSNGVLNISGLLDVSNSYNRPDWLGRVKFCAAAETASRLQSTSITAAPKSHSQQARHQLLNTLSFCFMPS